MPREPRLRGGGGGGAVLGGRQIVSKMWDNFARLTALLAKVRVWFNNLTIYLDFSVIFSQIAPSKPLNQGRHWGATFCRQGAPFRRGLQRYATVQAQFFTLLSIC